jgi:hypothetical protein
VDKEKVKNILKGHTCSNCKFYSKFFYSYYQEDNKPTFEESIDGRLEFKSRVEIYGNKYTKKEIMTSVKVDSNGEQIPYCKMSTDLKALPKPKAYTDPNHNCQYFWHKDDTTKYTT